MLLTRRNQDEGPLTGNFGDAAERPLVAAKSRSIRLVELELSTLTSRSSLQKADTQRMVNPRAACASAPNGWFGG